jgi:hypothetical protein
MNWNITTIQFYSFSIFGDGLKEMIYYICFYIEYKTCVRGSHLFFMPFGIKLFDKLLIQTSLETRIMEKERKLIGLIMTRRNTWNVRYMEEMIYIIYASRFSVHMWCQKSLKNLKYIVYFIDAHSVSLNTFEFWCMTKIKCNFLLHLTQSFPCLICRKRNTWKKKTKVWDLCQSQCNCLNIYILKNVL